jgi:ribosomal protein L11 methyltransferase
LLLAQGWAEGLRLKALEPVPAADWVRLTQAQFEPVPVTPDCCIVPSWHEPLAVARR